MATHSDPSLSYNPEQSGTSASTPVGKDQAEPSGKLPGDDLKQARGMEQKVGHSPNEAGTDQKVEDAKRERSNSSH